MTLTDLLTTLSNRGAIPIARLKDLKTSLRYLTSALKAEDPEAIPDAKQLGPRYRILLQTYFHALEPPVSPHTIRNTLNNLSFFYRQAHAHTLMPIFTPLAPRMTRDQAQREADRRSPYRHRYSHTMRGPKYALPLEEWTEPMRQEWEHYSRTRRLELRAVTVQSHRKHLEFLAGYGRTIEDHPLSTWDDLFDAERLERYIHWHAQRAKVPRITVTALKVAYTVRTIARYQHRPELTALQALVERLPPSEPMHNKQDPSHSIQLKDLEDVGLTLLHEARMANPVYSPRLKHPGSRRGIRHQTALILRLLVRVPMRQRNIRQMQLEQNLFQDDHGTWHLRFQGEELKIGRRNGRMNTFQIPFPPDLVGHLEEFLHHYRPLIPNTDRDNHVFISARGNPYTDTSLSVILADCVMVRLGKRFFPHLIRTIYTDTCLSQTHDISTVAFMLNDRPETVLQRYHELRANDHVQKAYQFSQSLLG